MKDRFDRKADAVHGRVEPQAHDRLHLRVDLDEAHHRRGHGVVGHVHLQPEHTEVEQGAGDTGSKPVSELADVVTVGRHNT